MHALKPSGELNFECQGTMATHDWEGSDLFEGELSMILKVITFFGLLAKTEESLLADFKMGRGVLLIVIYFHLCLCELASVLCFVAEIDTVLSVIRNLSFIVEF